MPMQLAMVSPSSSLRMPLPPMPAPRPLPHGLGFMSPVRPGRSQPAKWPDQVDVTASSPVVGAATGVALGTDGGGGGGGGEAGEGMDEKSDPRDDYVQAKRSRLVSPTAASLATQRATALMSSLWVQSMPSQRQQERYAA